MIEYFWFILSAIAAGFMIHYIFEAIKKDNTRNISFTNYDLYQKGSSK